MAGIIKLCVAGALKHKKTPLSEIQDDTPVCACLSV